MGYIALTEDELTYNYYAKDYQGNVKEVYSIAGANATTASCIQRMQYYPSGLPWKEGYAASEQPFKYNGKEFIEMHSLDEYDSEARWYYPAIMRTTTMDPLCEKYYSTSPYAWCGNNPVNLVDPDGRDAELAFDSTQKTITIKASYLAYSPDVESAMNAIDLWNQQSGNFVYIVNGEEYIIMIDLEVIDMGSPTTDRDEQNRQFLEARKKCSSWAVNMYEVVPDNPFDKVNGTTRGNSIIKVQERRRYSETGSHEVGHTLLIYEHTMTGIMTESSEDDFRSPTITTSNMSTILRNNINKMPSNNLLIGGKVKRL